MNFRVPQFAMASASILVQNWKITIPLRKGIWFQIGVGNLQQTFMSMTDKTINLGKECSEIPLVAVGDISGYWYAFQTQQTIQNSYGMLKGKWRGFFTKKLT